MDCTEKEKKGKKDGGGKDNDSYMSRVMCLISLRNRGIRERELHRGRATERNTFNRTHEKCARSDSFEGFYFVTGKRRAEDSPVGVVMALF